MSYVAPFAGVWIEIFQRFSTRPMSPSRSLRVHFQGIFNLRPVAPFAGAWIEIRWSSPVSTLSAVAPFAGAWIEIAPCGPTAPVSPRRSLRGSVD